MALKRNTKVDASFSVSSMTDIVFLLLIFFLVTSTLINPNALKLLLPKSTGQIGAKATVSVSIKDWGDDTYTYHINGDQRKWRTGSSSSCRAKRTRPSPSSPTRASPWAKSSGS